MIHGCDQWVEQVMKPVHLQKCSLRCAKGSTDLFSVVIENTGSQILSGVCVCVCVCLHEYEYVHVYTCTYAHASEYANVYTKACVYVYGCAYIPCINIYRERGVCVCV